MHGVRWYSVGRRSAEELCIIDREYMFSISISTVVTAVVRRMNWMHGSYDVFVVECCGDVLFAHAKWIGRVAFRKMNMSRNYRKELYMHAYYIASYPFHIGIVVSH